MGDSSSKLAVLVHHNNEVSVYDERGLPNLCRDCRHSGWLTGWERNSYRHPRTCLLSSGGGDVLDGDRVIFDDVGVGDWGNQNAHDRCADGWRKRYPTCWSKNSRGDCKDYIKAKPLPWWGNFWKKVLLREWRTRKMRL